ncbi:MAG: ECF-type sigma factor [Pirellulales bacterium]
MTASDVTILLNQISAGDEGAFRRLFEIVYADLHQIAKRRIRHENPGETLQATGLVHEAYLRLVGKQSSPQWENRAHFFAVATEAMRCILVDAARRRRSLKRGGALEQRHLSPDEFVDAQISWENQLVDIADDLVAFESVDEVAAKLVRFRLLGGLSVTEAGELLGLSRSVAYENWKFAQAWFAVRSQRLEQD